MLRLKLIDAKYIDDNDTVQLNTPTEHRKRQLLHNTF